MTESCQCLNDEDRPLITGNDIVPYDNDGPAPVISVLMITRNHSPYISQAIMSVLAQELDGTLELLIGEDASSDDTGTRCAILASRYPDTIRLFTSPEGPLGMHTNFARLLDAARGLYLSFLEGDDYWTTTDKLKRQIALMDLNPGLALCGTRTVVVEFEPKNGWRATGELGPVQVQPTYTFAELIPHYNFHFSSVLVRRSALKLPGWVSRQYCIDRPLYLLAAQHGDAGFIDAVTSAYRHHEGGVWSGQGMHYKAEASRKLFQALMEHFPSQYRPAFRRALSGILWYYLSEARFAENKNLARKLFWMALRVAPIYRLFRSPKALGSMIIWLWMSSRHHDFRAEQNG